MMAMSVQITIRDVPSEVRDELAARAARAGKSMQQYLRDELQRLAERPTMPEWLDRVQYRKRLAPRSVAAEAILESRDADRK